MTFTAKLGTISSLALTALVVGCAQPNMSATSASSSAMSAAAKVDITDWQTFETEAYRGKRDAISFVDRQHGWYGTGAGDLFRTQDGGAKWEKIASQPGTFVRSIAFLDHNTGFIGNIGTDYYPGVSDTVPLYRTDDGGVTWMPVDTGDATIKGVCAIDVTIASRIYQGNLIERTVIHAAGRVGGPAGILRSVDGGENWTVIDMADHAGMITDIQFFNENVGLVFGATTRSAEDSHGLILLTKDGGKSWTEVYRSPRLHEIIWKGHFPSPNVGYGTVQSYDTDNVQQRIVKSTDGGKSWNEMDLVEDSEARQFGIGFADDNTGFVGTMKGGFATQDGGLNWSSVPIARAANKFQIVGGDKQRRIYAVGTEVQALDFTVSE